jgi:outer membrane protein assembly factor BamB
VRADGSGKVEWENNTRVYVPSLLVKDGHLFGVLDAGIAACWKCDTGKEQWKGRIEGTFSSSPVLVGDVIYAINEAGKAYVYKANPSAFEKIGENQLGSEVFATPVIASGALYLRVAKREEGKRQEYVYCVAEK